MSSTVRLEERLLAQVALRQMLPALQGFAKMRQIGQFACLGSLFIGARAHVSKNKIVEECHEGGDEIGSFLKHK